jgi:hypothetical protein
MSRLSLNEIASTITNEMVNVSNNKVVPLPIKSKPNKKGNHERRSNHPRTIANRSVYSTV